MKGLPRLQLVVLIVLGILTTAVGIISFATPLSWLNKPFAGFLVYDPPYVGSYSTKDWPGRKAGLKFLDRIVSIDGQPVRKGRDVVEAIKQKQPGTPVRYVVESKGITREITVPVAVYGIKDFLLTFFITNFMCGLILCILGFIAVILKPNIFSSWIFLAFCLSLGGYMISGFEIMSSYHLVHYHYVVACLYPVLIFHLALIFPDRNPIVLRFPWFEYFIYLPIIALIIGWQVYLFAFPQLLGMDSLAARLLSYKFLGSVTRGFLLLSVISFIVAALISILKASNVSVRQRARMILLGATIGWLGPVVIMMASHVFKMNPTWNFLPFLVVFFPVSITYSIVQHNLFDADAIIRRTLGYVVVTALIVGAYVLVSVALNVLLGQYQLAQSQTFPILFTLGVILVFNPLRDRIQALVDRLFFRKEYDYGAIVEKVSGSMTSILELPQILKHLVQTFMEDVYIDTSSVMLLTPDGTQYQVHLADGDQKQAVENKTFKREDPLLKIIEKEKRVLTKYDLVEDPKYKVVSESSAFDFDALHASLIVPLVYQDQMIGSLNLGEKKSGKSYNREDIDLLRTLAHQGAVAIENARMVEEIIEKERLKAKIMDSFGKYVTSEVRDQILEGRIPLDGETKDVTVLFADLRGFTTLAESTSPKEVVKIINGYFSEMAEAIGQNRGLVLQFIGDEIEAVFGAPSPLENHPTHAVRAGLAMRERLVSVNEKLQKKGYAPLRHGIGIHTGNVVAANIGSEDRLSYALVGDTVNAASRIQGLNKEFGTDLLISATTVERLVDKINIEKMPATTVKGKKYPVEIFKLK
jgi:class 3 adenylate cyclase